MQKKTVRLVEGAVMVAFAVILSLLKILELPYGGSVTVCSMLPILIIAYRHGVGFGSFTALVYGVVQMLLGMKNVLYFTTPLSIAAVIILDYILAFAALGLGGAFRKVIRRQATALELGTLLACFVRYICHVISGCTVWAGLSIPSADALLYSLAYNATYMIPETIVTLLGAALIGRVLDFRHDTVTRLTDESRTLNVPAILGGVAVVGALIFDVCEVFAKLQDAETGNFLITGLADVRWGAVGIVSAICFIFAVFCFFVFSPKKDLQSKNK